MEEKYEKRYHELEDSHWWFVGRRKMIASIVKKFPQTSQILDIGCSGGSLINLLNEKGYHHVSGIDISKKAIQLCKKRGIKDVRLMSGDKLKFKKKFDIIIASDVLEHIKDDKKAVESMRQTLKKRGKVICFVPAFMSLWSHHDESNKHYRRYTKKTLSDLFMNNGFNILRRSYWNFSLFIPIFIGKRLISKKRGIKKESNLYLHSKIINKFMINLLKIENIFLSKFNFPFGVSTFVIAEKNGFQTGSNINLNF